MNNISHCIFIAADTMRSRAYAQALQNAGMIIKAGLIISSDKHKWGQSKADVPTKPKLENIFVPDLSTPLAETMSAITQEMTEINTGTINCPEVINFINKTGEEVCIFSGFGGEIVRDPVLNSGTNLLHIHSGWLPDYRGSTTVYYSILNGDGIGVSAIYLHSSIDTGPILAKKHYPLPPSSTELDYLYDSAIRSDLLVNVLLNWNESRSFNIEEQNADEGTTYYICHPVLKHIAVDRLAQTNLKHKRGIEY